MAKARFSKGQTVFQVCIRFATNKDTVAAFRAKVGQPTITEMRVISRTVDACGAKQVTFYDHGHDGVFGRKGFADDHFLFDNAADAFAYLEQRKAERTTADEQFIIHPEVVSDADWIPSAFK